MSAQTTTWRWKCSDRVMVASAANMADQDPAEHMVVISRGEGEERIKINYNEFVKFQFLFFPKIK